MIRPVIEFAAPVYFALLSAEQLGHLEQLQARALKTIFGWDKSYRTTLEHSGIVRIKDRLKELFQNFAIRASKVKRFQGWFPQNADPIHATRNREKYFIPPTKTGRLKNNPIYQMRRFLNEISREEPGRQESRRDLEVRN